MACRRRRNKAPHSLELGATWTIQRHDPANLPLGISPGTRWIGGWVSPRNGVDILEDRKIFGPCRNSILGPPVRSLVVIPTTLSRFPYLQKRSLSPRAHPHRSITYQTNVLSGSTAETYWQRQENMKILHKEFKSRTSYQKKDHLASPFNRQCVKNGNLAHQTLRTLPVLQQRVFSEHDLEFPTKGPPPSPINGFPLKRSVHGPEILQITQHCLTEICALKYFLGSPRTAQPSVESTQADWSIRRHTETALFHWREKWKLCSESRLGRRRLKLPDCTWCSSSVASSFVGHCHYFPVQNLIKSYRISLKLR